MSEYPKMNPEVKELWVQALRSGRFEQGQSVLRVLHTDGLRTTAAYCCLGVLCEISGIEYFGADMFPPKSVCEWAGLPIHEPAGLDEQTHVSNMNDGRDAHESRPQTFDQIADWIETNL